MATQTLPRSRVAGDGRTQPPGQGGPPAGTLVRWMWIWITLGILVVVVVIGFLIGIVRALESIDANLFEAKAAVQGIGRDAEPLPGSVQVINSTLGEIDTSLKPIRGQADEIGKGLGQITASLEQIDASLKDTNGSLADTSGSLVGTSGTLVTVSGTLVDVTGAAQQISGSLTDTSNVLTGVLGMAGTIEGVLEETQRVDSAGTALIPLNVAEANDVLAPVQADTANITARLVDVNSNLTAICTSLPLTVTGLVTTTRC